MDFKFLLPTNLLVIAAQPLVSLQTLTRIQSSKLAEVKTLIDSSASWAVYASIIGKISPTRLPDLIEYF